ncbi:MAG: 3,4-dihydroxy-2-butanone-4-phosphate synthase [Zestosphaera sp.]
MLEKAAELLRIGRPVFIYDSESRESEADIVFFAGAVNTYSITISRKFAGGLTCYVTSKEVGSLLGLRYLEEVFQLLGYRELTRKRLGYGDPPNFSLWVNHVGVKTGIRDSDKAKTVRELDEIVRLIIEEEKTTLAVRKFYSEFVTPGHLPILLGRGLDVRKGHTELSLALAELSGLRPSLIITEVLSDGDAATYNEVKKLAEKFSTVVVRGDEIISALEKARRM